MHTTSTPCTCTPSELTERLSAQAVLARAFQSVFGVEPTDGQLAALGSPAIEAAFRMLSLDESETAADARAFFAHVAERTNEAIERLKAEYTRLFIGPARLPAPPWESVYRGEDRLLLQSSTLEVRALYRSRGALPAHYPAVADDHVALELAFLHLVSRRAQELLANDADVDHSFLSPLAASMDRIVNEHLLAWLPRFSHALSCDDPQGYYAVCARLLVRFAETCGSLAREVRPLWEGGGRKMAKP